MENKVRSNKAVEFRGPAMLTWWVARVLICGRNKVNMQNYPQETSRKFIDRRKEGED